MKGSIRSQLTFVLVVLAVTLTACDTILEVGVVPTSTPVPTPTLTPTPSPIVETYTNTEYGFTFKYLSTWTLTEEPHVVRLNQDTLNLYIGYRWVTEEVDIWGRTGAPAGDFISGGKVSFLGQVIPAHVLEYQRKDKAVFYGESGLIQGEELDFVIYLDAPGADYDALDIPKELQAEVKAVLESFARIEATARPPAATPTVAPTATRTTAPTPTPMPEPTATQTAEARPSERIYLDETWHLYINYQMGFSIKLPVEMVHFLGACKWNEEGGDRCFLGAPAPVPVKVFEDGESVYIAPEYVHELGGERKQSNEQGQTRTCFSECNQVPNSLALLNDKERPWFSSEMWKLVAVDVHDDAELEAFVKSRYGSGCSIKEREATGQDGVYRVRIQGDGKDLSETLCPVNYATGVMYYPAGNKVIAWDLGQGPSFVGALDWSVTYDQEMVESFRFLTADAVDVVGWYGSVHSAPAGSDFDDYLSVLPEGVGEVGLVGASPAIEAMIADTRDKEPPNKYAHFWGTLSCGVSDYGGCRLWVTLMRPEGPGGAVPYPVEGWEGTVVTNPAWAQVDDAFVLAGDYPVHYGIWSEDPDLAARLEGYRNAGTLIQVWGQVLCGVSDANGCQIRVHRLEEVSEASTPTTEGDETRYENAEYGFSFQVPAGWTVEQVTGETRRDGTKLGNAVILTRGKFKIVVEYLDKSDPSQIGWDGSLTPALPYEEGVYGEKITVMGIDTHKRVWVYNDELKAIFVPVLADDADLVVQITLADSSTASIRDDEAETVPETAIAALDRILGSFVQIPAWASYADDEYGFSFKYPDGWTLAELPERKTETGRCANALVLSQDTLAITIQVLHPSQCCEQIAWCGVAWIIEPTSKDERPFMHRAASRSLLAHQDAIKAVDVSHIDEGADLGLLITLRDTSTQGSTAPEMASIPQSALAEFERILDSFEPK